jgi:hypothetical protein
MIGLNVNHCGYKSIVAKLFAAKKKYYPEQGQKYFIALC